MKILLTGLGDKLGGTESFIRVLVSGLNSEYEFAVLAATDRQYAMSKFFEDMQIPVFQFRNIFGIKHIFTRKKVLEHFFQDHHFDIVHINATTLNATYIAKAAKASGAKVVFQVHNAQASGYSAIARLLTLVNRPFQRRYLARSGTKLLSVSTDAANMVFGSNLAQSRVQIVVNGVDTEVLRFSDVRRQEYRNILKIKDNERVALVVARLMPIKNIDRTIELFKKAYPEILDQLLIIGEGPERGRLEELVKGFDNTIVNKIHFLGQREDVASFLSAADLLISTSIAEGLSTSVIEAQAAGLPVLASTGVPNVTNVTGRVYYVPLSDDDERWIDTLRKISLDLDATLREGENQVVMHSQFSMSTFIATFRKIYNAE